MGGAAEGGPIWHSHPLAAPLSPHPRITLSFSPLKPTGPHSAQRQGAPFTFLGPGSLGGQFSAGRPWGAGTLPRLQA